MTSHRLDLGGMPLFKAARAAGVQFKEEALPESKQVRVNGLNLHYLDWGNSSAPPLLALHGGAQTAHSWDFFCLSLRDLYHPIALDQRGHGDSDWSEEGDYTVDSFVSDADAFTDALHLPPFVLVGLSLGGRNAFTFAAQHPKKVKALIIADVGPDIQEEGRKRISEFLQDTETFESFDWLVARVKRYNPHREEEQIRGSLVNNLKQLPDGRWTWKHDRRRGLRREAGGEMTASGWECIASIRVPTLIVRGANSDIFAPATAQRMHAAIPDSRLVEVPKAGHLVQGDNPVGFEHVVRDFLVSLG